MKAHDQHLGDHIKGCTAACCQLLCLMGRMTLDHAYTHSVSQQQHPTCWPAGSQLQQAPPHSTPRQAGLWSD